MSYFMQFWPISGLYDPVKGPFHYQRSTLKGSYSPKSLHKFILPENLSTSNFREVEIKEICPKVVYQVILAIMWPYDPLKSPLHYQQSTLQGSYSPKILHKIVLTENGFIFIFLKRKYSKSAQNAIFHAILANFGTIWPTERPLTLPTVYVKWFMFSQNTP